LRVRIQGRPHGPLAGRTLAVKDNIAVAEVSMRSGPVLLDGYVPDEDAAVVERVLDAGAIILCEAVCESVCFSGRPQPHRRLVYRRTAAAGAARDEVHDAAQDRPDPIWLGHHRREDLRA
jgi:Asp-tRNA(Asn)/Glu-tRNA(Gln) amidotransferase A subunit family amidase